MCCWSSCNLGFSARHQFFLVVSEAVESVPSSNSPNGSMQQLTFLVSSQGTRLPKSNMWGKHWKQSSHSCCCAGFPSVGSMLASARQLKHCQREHPKNSDCLRCLLACPNLLGGLLSSQPMHAKVQFLDEIFVQ